MNPAMSPAAVELLEQALTGNHPHELTTEQRFWIAQCMRNMWALGFSAGVNQMADEIREEMHKV